MIKKMTESHSFSGWQLADLPQLVKALLQIKTACALANQEAQVLNSDVAGKIKNACDQLKDKIDNDTFPVDLLQGGGGIAINHNLNEAICNIDGSLSFDQVNASQSTVDVVATGIRLALVPTLQNLDKELAATIKELKAKGKEFAKIPTLARTCLRDATTTNLGAKFNGYAANLERCQQQLQVDAQKISKIHLGGTVIGDGQGSQPTYRKAVISQLAPATGLQIEPRENYMDGSQNIDEIAQVAHSLALLAESTIKMGKDLRLLNSGPRGGLGEISLPQVISGSSFFANKNNPTIVETLIQASIEVLGQQRAISACLEHGELDFNVFEAMAGVKTLHAAEIFSRAFHNFHRYALTQLKANPDRCKELSEMAASTKGLNHGDEES